MITLKEIAARAGVSVSTVSRIINSTDDSFARKPVRDKVWAIVKETGYVPNQQARELKQGNKSAASHHHRIACILGRTQTLEDNPFFAQVARAIEQHALALGYSVAASYSVFDIGNRDLLDEIETDKTDGAIVIGRFNSDALHFFEHHYKNIVYVGRNLVEAQWDQVVCDGYAATKAAIEYLIQNEHTRIGYIGETTNEIRYQAYADIVKERGLDDSSDLIGSCLQNGAGGYKGASRLIHYAKPMPTAIFCATDVTAIAAMKRFREEGFQIPSDLSVIGMDDIELAQYISPSLTTISMPKVELGQVAVNTLIARINKEHRLPMRIVLPYKLFVRESAARCCR